MIKYLKMLLRKLELSKINFLNHKFKKYIVNYEIKDDKIIIYNSNGDYKVVDNNIPNKVKVLEIIKDHEKLINSEINYYDNNKEDYKIIIISSSFLLIVLGFLFLFSFFVGNSILFILSLLSFIISLVLFSINIYKTILFRAEIKRLKSIKSKNIVIDDNELIDIIVDCYKYLKKYFYNFIMKIINGFDSIKKYSKKI